MNGIEEIYVVCPRARWRAAYLPELCGNNIGVGAFDQDGESVHEVSEDDESFNIETDEDGESDIGNFHLVRWHTQATLSQFDNQLAAFDNPGLDLRDESYFKDSLERSDGGTLTEDDSSLNLDNTSFDEDSLYHQSVSIITGKQFKFKIEREPKKCKIILGETGSFHVSAPCFLFTCLCGVTPREYRRPAIGPL